MRSLCILYGLSLLVFCSSQCIRYLDQGVSNSDKQFIVDKHNEYRRRIANGNVAGQPRGVNLKKMKWDDDLAKAAQDVSNTCVFAHSIAPDSRWPAVGQNLYISYSTASSDSRDWASALEVWFNEHNKYTFSNQFNSEAGHYTQLVWANTEYVGCGYTFFEGNGFYRYQKLYTCNYGPAGNYIGQYPYQTGTSGCENLC